MRNQVINERFSIVEKLGEGGMATVYHAEDLETGKSVALKMMKTSLSGTSQRRFAREFRAIASVDHPNCIRVFEFAESGVCPFFTMELFPSVPITNIAPHPLATVYSALYQTASAIEHVHQQQIIHRDLKPSNLLTQVNEAGEVVIKLSDFGLARFYGSPSSLSTDSGFVGTLAYSAPEQVASSGVDLRTDIYSLGILCYELLTGQHPFAQARASGPQSLIRAQLAEVPLPLRSLNPDVPVELEELVHGMLEKQSAKRPRSAISLKVLLAELLELEIPVTNEGNEASEIHTRWRSDAFVAREHELQSVSGVMTRALSPIQFSVAGASESLVPSVVFLTGEAGMGKSHFLREVARLAGRHGADVYEGRCFEANLSPFQPFVDIIRQLMTRIGPIDSSLAHKQDDKRWNRLASNESIAGTATYGLAKETVHDVVRKYSAELLRIAPELHTWLPGKAFRQTDLGRETNYVIRAIATFFVELSTMHGTCILIEDLHWVDQSSLDLLRHIASILHRSREQSVESNRSYPRLFICCTARPDDASFLRELERERAAQVIPLGKLSRDETRQLAANVLGTTVSKTPDAIVEELFHRCKGNPFFIAESLRAWEHSGRLNRQSGQWSLKESDGSSADWPDSVKGVLLARLESISPLAQRVLGPCAVIGSIIEVDVLRRTLDEMQEAEFLDALDELLARQVVFETDDRGTVEFTHDLLRELTYQQLSGHRRRAMHRRVAEVLERSGNASALTDQLAGHYFEARVVDPAFKYLLDAGEKALSQYAIDEALRHLGRAVSLEREVGDSTSRIRLHGIAATAYNAGGRPNDAMASYQKQLDLSSDPIEKAGIHEQIGRLLFRIGDFDKAVDVFDKSLQLIGDRRPRATVSVVSSTVASLVRFHMPGWLTRWIPKPVAKTRKVEIAHRVFSTFELLWAQRNVLQCGQAHGRHLNLARWIGDPLALTHASARQALICGIFSLNRLALKAGNQALGFAREADDLEAAAIARGHVGCAHYFGARLTDAEHLLRESLEVLDRRGDSWERMYFYHNLRHLYSITGDAQQEIACARVEMQIGEAVNDPEGTCWGAYGMANALARTGKHDEAQQYMERALGILSGRTNIVVQPTAMGTYGFVYLQMGNYQAAEEILEESCKNIHRDWAYIEYTVRSFPLYVESVLGPRWHEPSENDPKRLKKSWKASRVAKFWAWRFPNYMPHALRVQGRSAWAFGKQNKAVSCFKRAIVIGEAIGARFDVARSCIDLSMLRQHDHEEFAERGRILLNELQAKLPEGEQ